jgi:hypothetical protein
VLAVPARKGIFDPPGLQMRQSRLLDDSVRAVVRPDSVQTFGGMLFSRLPTWVFLGMALYRFACRRAPCRGVAPGDCPARNSNEAPQVLGRSYTGCNSRLRAP